MSSRKRSLSGDVNYETSCERKKQKKSERDASTVVDVSDDKSASIREKLRSKLLKKQQKSDEDNSNLEALEVRRRKLLAAEFACEILHLTSEHSHKVRNNNNPRSCWQFFRQIATHMQRLVLFSQLGFSPVLRWLMAITRRNFRLRRD